VGESYETFADVEATADECEALAGEILAWLVGAGIVVGERTACIFSQLAYEMVPFNDWEWVTEGHTPMAYVGFTFWEWPILSNDFVVEFGRRLGRRVVHIYGHC
jgi:hypothetical protein